MKETFVIYSRLTEAQADTCSLVLASADIAHRLERRWNGWSISVSEADAGSAVAHIEQYMAENADRETAPEAQIPGPPGMRTWAGLWVAGLLLAIHAWLTSTGAIDAARLALGASAARINSGEWYRCATALLVHGDILHLLGNMLGVAVFGTAVCQLTGPGVGILLISATGVLGNAMNAAIHGHGHLSIGASTAVFGALGILAVYQLVSRLRESGNNYRAWVPLGAGLALLGLLGSGAHTDIMAHLLGFAVGGVMGAVLKWRMHAPPGPRVQTGALLLSAAGFIFAWRLAWPG